jgi:hypothetical protein
MNPQSANWLAHSHGSKLPCDKAPPPAAAWLVARLPPRRPPPRICECARHRRRPNVCQSITLRQPMHVSGLQYPLRYWPIRWGPFCSTRWILLQASMRPPAHPSVRRASSPSPCQTGCRALFVNPRSQTGRYVCAPKSQAQHTSGDESPCSAQPMIHQAPRGISISGAHSPLSHRAANSTSLASQSAQN